MFLMLDAMLHTQSCQRHLSRCGLMSAYDIGLVSCSLHSFLPRMSSTIRDMPVLSQYYLPIHPIFDRSSNIRRRNVLHRMTTWAACPSFPINDSRSFGVQDLFPCHCWSSSFNSINFDSGSHILLPLCPAQTPGRSYR